MSNEEPNVHGMKSDIRLLQLGQEHIQSAVTGISNKLDGVVDALTTLVRLTEKHDALSERVRRIEDRNLKADDTVERGNAYMTAARWIAPVVVIIMGGLIGWLIDQNNKTYDKFTVIVTDLAEVKSHVKNHH